MTSALISVRLARSISSHIFEPMAAQRFTYRPRSVSGGETRGAGGLRMESGSGATVRRVSAGVVVDVRDLLSPATQPIRTTSGARRRSIYSRRTSSAASRRWPMSRDTARASLVALVTSSSALETPADRKRTRSSLRFSSARLALSSCDDSASSLASLAANSSYAALLLRGVGLALQHLEPLVEQSQRRAVGVGVEAMQRHRNGRDALDERVHRIREVRREHFPLVGRHALEQIGDDLPARARAPDRDAVGAVEHLLRHTERHFAARLRHHRADRLCWCRPVWTEEDLP